MINFNEIGKKLFVSSIFLLLPILLNAEEYDSENSNQKYAYIKEQLTKDSENQRHGVEYAVSVDGSRVGVYESIMDLKILEKNLVSISVWDTVNKRLINKSTFTENENVTSNSNMINMLFSKDNKILVVGMPVGSINLTWDYEVEKNPVKSCFSYMGTIINDVSEDGKFFLANTNDGMTMLCESQKETGQGEELFGVHSAYFPDDIKMLGDELRIKDELYKGKLQISYNPNSPNSNKLLSILEKKYSFIRFINTSKCNKDNKSEINKTPTISSSL